MSYANNSEVVEFPRGELYLFHRIHTDYWLKVQRVVTDVGKGKKGYVFNPGFEIDNHTGKVRAFLSECQLDTDLFEPEGGNSTELFVGKEAKSKGRELFNLSFEELVEMSEDPNNLEPRERMYQPLFLKIRLIGGYSEKNKN